MGGNTDVLVRTEIKLKVPKLYKVLLLNDDYTPMDFVVQVLVEFFNHTEQTAKAIMWDIHKKGQGIAGVYPLEIAEQKKLETETAAFEYGHPLKCTLEEE